MQWASWGEESMQGNREVDILPKTSSHSQRYFFSLRGFGTQSWVIRISPFRQASGSRASPSDGAFSPWSFISTQSFLLGSTELS